MKTKVSNKWRHKLILNFPGICGWICRLRVTEEKGGNITVLCLFEMMENSRPDKMDWKLQFAAARKMERLAYEQGCQLFKEKNVRFLMRPRASRNKEPELITDSILKLKVAKFSHWG
jgi:hypothetical protein